MTTGKSEHDDLDPINRSPSDAATPSPTSPIPVAANPASDAVPTKPAPLPLEDDVISLEPPSPRVEKEVMLGRPSVKDLDVCPNCGASMGPGELVCLRCGFDLKHMKVVQTVTGETTVEEEKTLEAAQLLVQPGLGDLWLPGAMAGAAGLILMIGYLAGFQGLFPTADVAASTVATSTDAVARTAREIGLAERMKGLLQGAALIAMWTGCGVAALAFLAQLLGLRLGDLKLATARMLGIVVTMRLASLMNLSSPGWEWVVEAIAQAAIFTGLVIVLFKLKPRDAPTLGGATVVMFMLLWVSAHLMVWVTG